MGGHCFDVFAIVQTLPLGENAANAVRDFFFQKSFSLSWYLWPLSLLLSFLPSKQIGPETIQLVWNEANM